VEASTLRAGAPLAQPRAAWGAPLLRLRSDEQLVALFRAGSEEAFRVIHDRYHRRLLAYTRQMLADRQDAEDALQDVFVRAYSGLRASGRDLALRAWLFRVAHNRCIDQLRKPPRPTGELLELVPATTHDPATELDRRESLRRLLEDIRRLPGQQRSALLMRELGGMSYAELADSLEVSVGAVKSLLVRARLALAQAAEARDTACEVIREQLMEAHDRGTRPSAHARRHMRDCPGCKSFRRELRGVSRRLAATVPALAPAAALARVVGFSGGGGAGGGAAILGGSGSAASSGGLALAVNHVATLIVAAAATVGGAAALQHTLLAPHSAHRAGAAARPHPPGARRLVLPGAGAGAGASSAADRALALAVWAPAGAIASAPPARPTAVGRAHRRHARFHRHSRSSGAVPYLTADAAPSAGSVIGARCATRTGGAGQPAASAGAAPSGSDSAATGSGGPAAAGTAPAAAGAGPTGSGTAASGSSSPSSASGTDPSGSSTTPSAGSGSGELATSDTGTGAGSASPSTSAGAPCSLHTPAAAGPAPDAGSGSSPAGASTGSGATGTEEAGAAAG